MIAINLIYTLLLLILYLIFYIGVPAVVLYPLIREREVGFRLLFYQIAGLAYVSLVSFALCFTGLYSGPMCWLVFLLAPVAMRLVISKKEVRATLTTWKHNFYMRQVLTEGSHMRRRRWWNNIKGAAIPFYYNHIRPNFLNLLSLALIVYLTTANLGYFHLHNYTYTTSDEPTHIYWVNSLISGNPFPAGLYPHGMHFVVGMLCSMFNLNVTRAFLSFGIVSTTVIMFSAYLTAWKLFSGRLAGLIGVAIFLCSGLYNPLAYSRLMSVMPMEFAVYAFFVTAYGLISWIQDQKKSSLVMVGLGILGTTLIHFFVTVFTFFLVVVFILVFHNLMAKRKCLHQLMLCGMIAVVVAVLPYAVGMACGFQLEQSFAWGVNQVNTSSAASTEDTAASDSDALPVVGQSKISEPSDNTFQCQLEQADSLQDYLELGGWVMTVCMTQTATGGYLLLGCCLFLIVYGGILSILKRKNEQEQTYYQIFLFIALAWIVEFGLLYVGYVADLFSLVLPTRSVEFIAMLSILIMGAPVQLAYDLACRCKLPARKIDSLATVAAVAAVAVMDFSNVAVTYKDLQYSFIMDDLCIETEEYLIDKADPQTWTVIGTTNARMAVVVDGFHYEITDLLRYVQDKDELYIPTKDIYVVVENNVPYMNTNILVDGSDFDSLCEPVTAELASIPLTDVLEISNGTIDSSVYLKSESRQVIMSHLYYWMEKMKQIYPNEITVFRQDDNCTVYKIEQDEYFLLNLVVDYTDLVEADLAEEGEE